MTEAAPAPAADNAPAPAAPETAPKAVETPAPAKDWRESIPEDIRANPSIAKFLTAKDMQEFTNTVAKSYVSASQMIGRDRVPIPKEGEDWSDFYKAAGRPDDPGGYELKAPEGLPEGFYDADSAEAFKTWAHEAGLNKQQAARLHDRFVGLTAEQAQQAYNDTMAKLEQGKQTLKAEWGNAFEAKVQAAARVAKELGGNEFVAYLEETGLGNDPRMVKAMARVAEVTKGDAALVGTGGDAPMTPLQLDGEIAAFREANNAALMDKFHTGHAAAVAKLQALYTKRYPPKSAVA